jgi:hypothetical protein
MRPEVRDHRPDKEQREACGCGNPDQWNANTDQQSECIRCLEYTQGGEPRFRHSQFAHVAEKPLRTDEVACSRVDVGASGHDRDNDLGCKHAGLLSFFAKVSSMPQKFAFPRSLP